MSNSSSEVLQLKQIRVLAFYIMFIQLYIVSHVLAIACSRAFIQELNSKEKQIC